MSAIDGLPPLREVMAEHGLDPEPYLAEVHDIDLGHVLPDPGLLAAIAALPGRKVVYTNGSREHARRVTAALGLTTAFDALYGFEDAGYLPKPGAAAFAAVFRRDGLAPAAAAMFTEEIGYPPYRGSERAYRLAVEALIRQQRTLVRVDEGRVVFKADLGSVALGVAQVQGVWVHPDLRGQGLAVPAMAAVVAHTVRHVAPVVSLYVNDFNAAAAQKVVDEITKGMSPSPYSLRQQDSLPVI